MEENKFQPAIDLLTSDPLAQNIPSHTLCKIISLVVSLATTQLEPNRTNVLRKLDSITKDSSLSMKYPEWWGHEEWTTPNFMQTDRIRRKVDQMTQTPVEKLETADVKPSVWFYVDRDKENVLGDALVTPTSKPKEISKVDISTQRPFVEIRDSTTKKQAMPIQAEPKFKTSPKKNSPKKLLKQERYDPKIIQTIAREFLSSKWMQGLDLNVLNL